MSDQFKKFLLLATLLAFTLSPSLFNYLVEGIIPSWVFLLVAIQVPALLMTLCSKVFDVPPRHLNGYVLFGMLCDSFLIMIVAIMKSRMDATSSFSLPMVSLIVFVVLTRLYTCPATFLDI